MAFSQAVSRGRLIRPARRGFCPACRFWLATAPGHPRDAVEFAAPALTVLVFLIVAAVAWGVMLGQTRSGGDMTMGLGLASLKTFSVDWVVMMAAMMFPSAMPLVFAFAENSERRRGWQAATGVLGLTYLAMWLAFGLVCFVVLSPLPMSWLNYRAVGGVALVLAGLYGITPLRRASEARCRELCALHGPLPFNLMRSGFVVGAKYGLSCIGCSAALMVALLLVGMSSVLWIVVVSAVVLVYKLAPASRIEGTLLISAAVAALGPIYILTA